MIGEAILAVHESLQCKYKWVDIGPEWLPKKGTIQGLVNDDRDAVRAPTRGYWVGSRAARQWRPEGWGGKWDLGLGPTGMGEWGVLPYIRCRMCPGNGRFFSL